jgi:hypothetical protein
MGKPEQERGEEGHRYHHQQPAESRLRHTHTVCLAALLLRRRVAHKPSEEMLQDLLWIFAEAGVDRRRLDHRARRGHQPVEALGGLKAADRPGLRIARRDPRKRFEPLGYRLRLDAREERVQAVAIERDPRGQKAQGSRKHHDSGIEELAAFEVGHDA